MDLELKDLTQTFEDALERVFAEVPFEERLEVTRKALAPFGLSEERVLEAARPGVFRGVLPEKSLLFLRYGSAVLAARGESVPGEEGEWKCNDDDPSFSIALSAHWASSSRPLPPPVLEGARRALELVAEEEGVKPPPPLPELTARLGMTVRAGDLVLVELDVLDSEKEIYPKPWLLLLGREGTLLVNLTKDPALFQRKEEVLFSITTALNLFADDKPATIPEETFATLLEGEGIPGISVLEALRTPGAYDLLRLGRL